MYLYKTEISNNQDEYFWLFFSQNGQEYPRMTEKTDTVTSRMNGVAWEKFDTNYLIPNVACNELHK